MTVETMHSHKSDKHKHKKPTSPQETKKKMAEQVQEESCKRESKLQPLMQAHEPKKKETPPRKTSEGKKEDLKEKISSDSGHSSSDSKKSRKRTKKDTDTDEATEERFTICCLAPHKGRPSKRRKTEPLEKPGR